MYLILALRFFATRTYAYRVADCLAHISYVVAHVFYPQVSPCIAIV